MKNCDDDPSIQNELRRFFTVCQRILPFYLKHVETVLNVIRNRKCFNLHLFKGATLVCDINTSREVSSIFLSILIHQMIQSTTTTVLFIRGNDSRIIIQLNKLNISRKKRTSLKRLNRRNFVHNLRSNFLLHIWMTRDQNICTALFVQQAFLTARPEGFVTICLVASLK